MLRLFLLASALGILPLGLKAQMPLSTSNPVICSNGLPGEGALEETKPQHVPIWGTDCPNGTGRGSGLRSILAAPEVFHLYLAGYPSAAGNRLALELVDAQEQLTLRPLNDPGLFWEPYEFRLPASWRGKKVRFVAECSAGGPASFFAFSEPISKLGAPSGWEAPTLLLRAIVSWIFLFLPGFWLVVLLVQRGCGDLVVLGCALLSAIAGWGYFCAGLWFLSPVLGQCAELVFAFVGLGWTAFRLVRLDSPSQMILSKLLSAAALSGAVALLVLSMGFLYGGIDTPFYTASIRFSHPLPPDNQLPYLFAVALAHGHIAKPLAGGWLSSDRPPLETGLYLAQYFVARGRFGYTIVGVLCQSLWIFALWLFLQSLALQRTLIGLSLSVCLASGFLFLNSFYVWPKLLATAYMLAFSLFLFSRRYRGELTSQPWLAALAGSLLAFGMLSHGGSAFALAGLMCTLLVRRERVAWRSLALLALTAGIVYLPWLAYQKFFDPPGNQVLKVNLAGVSKIDSRSLGQALHDAYGALSLSTWWTTRMSDIVCIIGPQASYWRDFFSLFPQLAQRHFVAVQHLATNLRALSFFYFLPCLGLLMFGPIVLLLTREASDKIAAHLWLFVFAMLLVWCLLMFSPGSTVLHQGTYVVVPLAFCGSLAALWSVSPVWAYSLGFANVVLNVLLYVFWMRPAAVAGVIYSGVIRYPTLCLALGACAAILVLLRRLPDSSSSSA